MESNDIIIDSYVMTDVDFYLQEISIDQPHIVVSSVNINCSQDFVFAPSRYEKRSQFQG